MTRGEAEIIPSLGHRTRGSAGDWTGENNENKYTIYGSVDHSYLLQMPRIENIIIKMFHLFLIKTILRLDSYNSAIQDNSFISMASATIMLFDGLELLV